MVRIFFRTICKFLYPLLQQTSTDCGLHGIRNLSAKRTKMMVRKTMSPKVPIALQSKKERHLLNADPSVNVTTGSLHQLQQSCQSIARHWDLPCIIGLPAC